MSSEFYISRNVTNNSNNYTQGKYTSAIDRNDVLPEGSIHIATKVSRELANKRKHNTEVLAADKVHGGYTTENDVNIQPHEIVVIKKSDSKARAFSSTTGEIIPPNIKTQYEYEQLFQFLGISLAGFRLNDVTQPGNTFATTIRGMITIWNTGRWPINFGDPIRIALKPIDENERRKVKGQPTLPHPVTLTKNNILTEPARFDEVHQFDLQVQKILANGKTERTKSKSELDGWFDDSAEAMSNFVMQCVLVGVMNLQMNGCIEFRNNFDIVPSNDVDVDETLKDLHDQHYLRANMININTLANMLGVFKNTDNQNLVRPTLKANILKTLFDTTKLRLSNSIADNDVVLDRHRAKMQKSEVNNLIHLHKHLQEGIKDYQNSIIGTAYQNAFSGDRFDICI